MEHATLACCYFPTTVAFIDDHESFLDNITRALSTDLIHKSFTTVSAFDAFLAKHPSQLQQNEWMHAAEDTGGIDPHGISVNFHLLYEQIYNLNRYNEISVAVVDYAMPEHNGIELCQIIKKNNPCIKTLLLTGEADHKIAVQAFNNNLIDQFLLKDSSDEFVDHLDAVIHQLMRDYFSRTFENLNMNFTGKSVLLNDPAFLELFNATYKKHHACEYYLIDPAGGYLMLNAKGEAMWLIIKNEEDVQTYCELANNEEDLDKSALKSILGKKCIPFYHGEYLNMPIKDWKAHLLPANQLKSHGTSYPYAIYVGFQHSMIDTSKVHSFHEYAPRRK